MKPLEEMLKEAETIIDKTIVLRADIRKMIPCCETYKDEDKEERRRK